MFRGIAVGILISAVAFTQTVPVIDLTEVIPKNRTREPVTVSVSGGLVGGDQQISRQASSLNLEIVSVEKSNRTTPSIIFQIRLRAVGQHVVPIPVDPHLVDFEPKNANEAYSYTSANISIAVKGAKTILPGVLLYGSKQVANSLRQVYPGESIEIRGRAMLESVNPSVLSKLATNPPVEAKLLLQQNYVDQKNGTLHQESAQIMPQITSSNAVFISP